MKRLYALFLSLLMALTLHAQSLVVQSFQHDETDLTAITAGTIVIDQNGQKCALIKVETSQTGFSFDAGSLGVVKTEQKVGEIWVYVPEGVKRLTISHQQLGVLRDYDLGQTLKRGKTYILKLTSGEVQTVIKQARTSQYVVFEVTPKNAVVELNGELLTTVDGMATKMMRFGTYDYRVQAPDYQPEVGKIEVNNPKEKHTVKVSLKSTLSMVALTVDNNAEIWVNGTMKGVGSWTGPLGAGTYEIESRLASHRSMSITRDIEPSSDTLSIHLQAPVPIYGEADINSNPPGADIFVDGQKKGQTPQLISQLLIGDHQLKLTRKGYDDYTGVFNVTEGEAASVSATMELFKEKPKPAPVAPAAETKPASGEAPAVEDDGSPRKTFTVGNIQFSLIRVEGGTFKMGASKEQEKPDADEYPVHDVTLSTYYIGETEVTQELWQAIMFRNPSQFKGPQMPVEQVSYRDCEQFIDKLNKKLGTKFRLPTEAEWEYAARGGNQSHGFQYSGSNKIDDVAWIKDNSGMTTHRVGTKAANELGIYDMSGNVWEWCSDWSGAYSSSPETNPKGPATGPNRIDRGGCYANPAWGSRVTNRGNHGPVNRYLGLRLAM